MQIGRCGALPSKDDPRTFKMASLLVRGYPAPPMAQNYLGVTKFSWFLNDRLGTCTIASIAHYMQLTAALRGQTITITDAEIDAAYRAVSGYDGTPGTDRGAMPINALVHAYNKGIGKHKIGGFARFQTADRHEFQAVVDMFGAALVSSRLPLSIEDPDQKTEWSLRPPAQRTARDRTGSLGGHMYLVGGYGHRKTKARPWVTDVDIWWPWHDEHTVEGWAIFDDAWVSGQRPAPNGFDLVKLRGFLSAL